MPDQALSAYVPKVRSTDRQPSTVLADVGFGAVVGGAYYIGCLAGFALRFPSSGIAYIWPPNGILVAALLLLAPRAWPTVLGGAFVAHAVAHSQNGLPPGTWVVQFVGNGLQAVLAAAIVRRFTDRPLRYDTLSAVGVFIVGAALVAPAVASSIPAIVYVT